MSKTAKVMLSVVGVVTLLVFVLLGVAGYAIYGMLSDGGISKRTYDSIRLGESEADVLAKLPKEQSELAADGLAEKNPPPAGAACRYHVAKDELGDDPSTAHVYRFCFANGKLTHKTRL